MTIKILLTNVFFYINKRESFNNSSLKKEMNSLVVDISFIIIHYNTVSTVYTHNVPKNTELSIYRLFSY